MKRLIAVLLAVLAMSASLARTTHPADLVVAQVRGQGAEAAVKDIWSHPARVRQLLRGIGRGDGRWLRAGEALIPGADAGAAEDLEDAFAKALLIRPYAVLPWLQQHWWASSPPQTCVFDKDSEVPGGVRRYVEGLRQALSQPAPPPLESLRGACLRGISATLRSLSASSGEPDDAAGVP
ncbi:hypothetical protein [Dyella thiooxydans]|uniref:hypothetical protein n=1 Tax=Dyella thiooxydans TaxID=445710 RepID=UPI0007C4C6F6|nr:hypothetical protein [Dyella thiooxydans]